jgi:uncharacterized membrane protein
MFSNLVSNYAVIYIALTVIIVTGVLLLEKHSKFIRVVSAPVIIMLLGSLFTTIGVTPAYMPVYDFYFSYLMSFAAILFVLKFDVAWLFKHGKRIAFMFLCTSFITFAGITLAGSFFDLPEVEKITGGIVGEFIGGPPNLFAVKEAVGIDDVSFGQFLFADNIWAIIAMTIVFSLPSWKFVSRFFRRIYGGHTGEQAGASDENSADAEKFVTNIYDAVPLQSVFVILSIGLLLQSVIVPFCAWAGESVGNVMLNQVLSTPLVVASFAGLFIAVPFKKQMQKIQGEDTIAYFIFLMTAFTVGSFVDLRDILSVNPGFFLLLIICMTVNIFGSLLLGKIFKIPFEEICLCVAASYAGPGEAFTVAKAQNWHGHVRLGVMVGMLGYIIGSILGVLSANILLALN